jgi:hypothetical protein
LNKTTAKAAGPDFFAVAAVCMFTRKLRVQNIRKTVNSAKERAAWSEQPFYTLKKVVRLIFKRTVTMENTKKTTTHIKKVKPRGNVLSAVPTASECIPVK